MSKQGKILLACVIVLVTIWTANFVYYSREEAPETYSTAQFESTSTRKQLLPPTTAVSVSSTASSSSAHKISKSITSIPSLPISSMDTHSSAGSASSSVVGTSTTQTTNTPEISDPPQLSPNPQAIVGILCYYNDTYTDKNTGQSIYSPDDEEVRGSGVIINSKGNILTNRHIIEQPEEDTAITDDNGNSVPVSVTYQLDHCDVGQLPANDTLPTVSQIESVNPYVQIPVLGYTAMPVYVSQTSGLSNAEIQYADFAVLGITGVSSSGPTFGVNSVPNSFPYITLLPINNYPDVMNAQVVTYGFPGDVTSGQGNFFETLTMTGSVGSVSDIYDGDQYYAGTPLEITTDLAIAHGRSGSPLFWRGYDIGIVTFFVGENQTDSGSVASDAILKALKGTGYILGD